MGLAFRPEGAPQSLRSPPPDLPPTGILFLKGWVPGPPPPRPAAQARGSRAALPAAAAGTATECDRRCLTSAQSLRRPAGAASHPWRLGPGWRCLCQAGQVLPAKRNVWTALTSDALRRRGFQALSQRAAQSWLKPGDGVGNGNRAPHAAPNSQELLVSHT